MVIILLKLTRVNPDRNIFSINVELTSTFLLYRGLVHHHHPVFKPETHIALFTNKCSAVSRRNKNKALPDALHVLTFLPETAVNWVF